MSLLPRRQLFASIAFATVLATIPLLSRVVQAQDEANAPQTSETTQAQAQNPADRRPRNLLVLLDSLDYDADAHPPLIVVDAARWLFANGLPDRGFTIAGLTDQAGLRLVPAGQVRALVPPMMFVLTSKPARANPFKGMRPDETLKLLLETLTHSQWQLIGAPNGIGAGDLTEDQRLLWDEVVPATMDVQKSTVQPGDEPGSWKYVDTTILPVAQPQDMRIRLNRETSVMFYKSGSTEIGAMGNLDNGDETAGQTKYMLRPGRVKSDPGSLRATSAYGVTLITTQANRLKPSAIDYDSPSLDAPISLHFPPRPPIAPSEAATNAEMPLGFAQRRMTQEEVAHLALPPAARARITPEMIQQYNASVDKVHADAAKLSALKTTLPTVGDVLARISKTTRFDFVADRRVRDFPVFLRGESARSGDVLQALARSVGGAFRKLDGLHAGSAQTYLLTSDVEGVGTRAARLSEWASDAEELKSKMMAGVVRNIAANGALATLTFSADDKLALSPATAQLTEGNWAADKEDPDIKRDDLSAALQSAIDATQAHFHESGTSLRNDRVRVGEKLGLSFIVPGIGAIKDPYTGQGVAWDFLRQVSQSAATIENAKKKVAPGAKPAAKASPPMGFPPKLKRRVLLAAAGSPTECAALARLAASKGITDLWLSISLADMQSTVAMLQATIKAAAGRISVAAAISLLRESGGIPAEPELDIQGETGDEFRERWQSRWTATTEKESHDYDYDQYAGWIVPDRAQMKARLETLASVPGLAGIALLSTAAPGWTGEKQGGDDILVDLGYSLETRRQFLQAYGMDPIDIPSNDYLLSNISWDLGPFQLKTPNQNYVIVGHNAERGPADAAPRSAFLAFRAKENANMLADLYADLKRQRPDLPLYLDDRVSPYGTQRPLSWYGSWDTADRLPINPPFSVESEGHAAARHASKTVFADWGWWWSGVRAYKEGAPADFARQVAAAALRNGPPAWDGMAMDMTGVPAAELIRLLGGLPDAAAR